ncbi:MAG: redoxin family protein [Clostridia bacterium]|nr:redoxin family protein [Clostridia bacterium]
MKKLIAILLAAVMMVFSAAVSAADDTAPKDAVGMSLAGLSAYDVFGNPVDDSVFSRAAVTVINYWAVWCGPCLAEMPDFVTLDQYYGATPEADVQIIGVVYYIEPEEIPEAQDIITQNGYNWTNLVANDQLIEIAATYDPQGIFVPQTLIVDRNGVIRAHWGGRFTNYSELYGFVSGWLEVIAEDYPVIIPGDANGDGTVDSTDALMVLRMALMILPVSNFEAADINGNGEVDSADALMILRLSLGLPQ